MGSESLSEDSSTRQCRQRPVRPAPRTIIGWLRAGTTCVSAESFIPLKAKRSPSSQDAGRVSRPYAPGASSASCRSHRHQRETQRERERERERELDPGSGCPPHVAGLGSPPFSDGVERESVRVKSVCRIIMLGQRRETHPKADHDIQRLRRSASRLLAASCRLAAGSPVAIAHLSSYNPARLPER